MKKVELVLPPGDVIAGVETLAASLGLIALRFTLKKYPGCTHWHFSAVGEKGTLECTWWPAHRRLWLSVHQNRSAKWQERAIADFQDLFQ